MATDMQDAAPSPKRRSKKPLLLGAILAICGAAGGYAAVSTGAVAALTAEKEPEKEAHSDQGLPSQTFAFVGLDPLVLSLPSSGGRDHLRFAAQLEVNPDYAAEVEAVKPRIVDVLNGYLRAVDLADLEDPAALMRLRAQMLRRIQVVTGPDRVKDLLIMEFVLS